VWGEGLTDLSQVSSSSPRLTNTKQIHSFTVKSLSPKCFPSFFFFLKHPTCFHDNGRYRRAGGPLDGGRLRPP